MPGVETLGGGNPEWRVPADQAPVSPGHAPDASKIVDQGSTTDWSADAVLNGILQPFNAPVPVKHGQHPATSVLQPIPGGGEPSTLLDNGSVGYEVDSEVVDGSPLGSIAQHIHNRRD